MPKRPIQHQLEDISIAKFQSIIPRAWVFRRKEKDYGIDGEVEIFSRDERATGLLFYVQLKATASDRLDQVLNIDFKIDTLKYFGSLELPVMLVRYADITNKIYVKWLTGIDTYSFKKDAKTFRIKLNESNEWGDETSTNIEKVLKNLRKIKYGKFHFPISYSLHSNCIYGVISNVTMEAEIRKRLARYSDFLDYTKDRSSSYVSIDLSDKVLSVNISILKGAHFHISEEVEKSDLVDRFAEQIIIGLARGLAAIGQAENSGRLIFHNNLQKRLFQYDGIFMELFPLFLRSSYFFETMKLIEGANNVEDKQLVLFPSITIVLLKLNTKDNEKTKAIEQFFIGRLNQALELSRNFKKEYSKPGFLELVATSYYNLGSFYRVHSFWLESIHNYVLAKRYDATYLDRYYFHHNIASVLFNYGKYYFSSQFYERSIELEVDVETIALYADALLFSGRYEEARINFLKYVEKCEETGFLFLKAIIINILLENHNTNYQIRNPTLADSLSRNLTNITTNRFSILRQALYIDFLSSITWFNLGVVHYDLGNYLKSSICHCMCAIVNQDDVEAWCNAFLLIIHNKVYSTLNSLILSVAYDLNGDDFLIKLNSMLEYNEVGNDIIEEINTTLLGQDSVVDKSNLKELIFKEIDELNIDILDFESE